MKRRPARLAVLLAATLTLLATATPPASATTVKEGVFLGEVYTGPLSYPCLPPGTFRCLGVPRVETKDPFKTVPTVNIIPAGGNSVGFAFNSDACAKGSAEAKPLGGGYKPTGPALCRISAAGTVRGYCGHSTAKGVMTLVNLGPPPFEKSTVTVDFTWTEVAHIVVITGESGNTQVVAEAANLPGLPAPNCTTNAQTFTLAGNFTVITKTLIL